MPIPNVDCWLKRLWFYCDSTKISSFVFACCSLFNSKTSDISLIPLSRVPFQETFNISSALWQVYGWVKNKVIQVEREVRRVNKFSSSTLSFFPRCRSTAFTAGLQNASVPGTSNGMIWDYPDLASSNYSAGISTVPATDLKVTVSWKVLYSLVSLPAPTDKTENFSLSSADTHQHLS